MVYRDKKYHQQKYHRVSPFEYNHFFVNLKGTDSDLDKILHICLDSQETAKTKILSQDMGLQNIKTDGSAYFTVIA
jgi:hypothetical protein